MKKEKQESIENPIMESRRYIDNARNVLQNYAILDTETRCYNDRKYVRAAGHYLWSGVLIILDATFHVNEKKGRIGIDDYRKAVGPRDRKLLALVNNAYDILHLNMGYDGVLNKKVCDEGFLIANEIIDRCGALMPS